MEETRPRVFKRPVPGAVPKPEMPTSETPNSVDERPEMPEAVEVARPETVSPGNGAGPSSGGSRWVDYSTHDLLEMISELEDERRWARLREGMLWAFLVHVLLIAAVFMLPRYLPRMTPIIETSNLHDKNDFTYLDSPYVPKPKPVKPLAEQPQVDKKTLEELKKQTPAPTEKAAPQPEVKAPEEQKPQVAPPVQTNQQSQIEAPRPAAVPAKPNFSMLSQNPSDQLQQAMRDAARSRGGVSGGNVPGGLPLHPGAGTGGVSILSDTQGVDFSAWLAAWYYDTRRTWDPLIPDEANPPISKQGQVMIRFKVLPNGRLMDGSLVLEGRSGDTALDRAAWGALTGSSYPPLPRDFHGPYLELRAIFLYNMQPPN
jgi:outer membrane biosynthesis protein TonB